MNSILPEGKQIRIRSFYGFGPEEDGYVGWTQESSRDAYLRKLNDGDLIMIYGASDELNAGIPPAATGRWALRVNSQPFPDKKSAEDVEAQFKQISSGRLESLGGEFFWGNLEEAESLCWSLPGMSRF